MKPRLLFVVSLLLAAAGMGPRAAAQDFAWAHHLDLGVPVAARAVASGPSGEVWLAGFGPPSAVRKLDAAGNLLFDFLIEAPILPSHVAVAPDGAVYVAGTFYGNQDFDWGPGGYTLNSGGAGVNRGFLLKMTSAGEFVWAQYLEALSVGGLAVGPAGEVYISWTGGGPACLIGRIDPATGLLLWNLQGPGVGFELEVDERTGDVIWAAWAGQAFVRRHTSSGVLLWTTLLSGELATDVTWLPDGGVAAVGQFTGTIDLDPGAGEVLVSAPAGGGFLVELDGSGSFRRGHGFVDPGGSTLSHVAWDRSAGALVAVGTYRTEVDADPGPAVTTLTSTIPGARNVAVITFGTAGQLVSAVALDGPTDDVPYAFAVGPTGRLHIALQFQNTVDFDPGPSEFLLTTNSLVDGAVWSLQGSADSPGVTVRLLDSAGSGLAGAAVTYSDAGWRAFGTTGPAGDVRLALPPASYTFAIAYAGGRIQKAQDVAVNPVVTFQTREVTVQLNNSAGNAHDTGTADYYASGWKSFGTTSGGEVRKELLPTSYTFAMTYAGGRVQKTQDVAVNPVVTFRTREVAVQLKDSAGNALDTGTADYYASGWKPIGTTSGGETRKELLPTSYTFAMTYAGGRVQTAQDVAVNPVVTFQTREVTVQVKDSAGNALDTGTADYYASGWRPFGMTSGGETRKELLPASYTFAMTYAGGRVQKVQDVAVNPVVGFRTGAVLSDSATCSSFYATGWRPFTQGIELLPGTYSFRFTTGTPAQQQFTIAAATENHIR